MNIQEMATAVQYRIPVKVVILNNGALGLVRVAGALFPGEVLPDVPAQIPDFVRLAEAYGAKGFRATRHAEVPDVLRKGFAAEGPVLIDVVVDPGEMSTRWSPRGLR